jgi:cytochrome c peroxidase
MMMKQIIGCALMLTGLLVPIGSADAAPTIDNLLLKKLGGAIFTDTNLSKNRNQSCMTCHHPSAGFADPVNLTYPTKLPVSEGSISGLFGGRNAPSAAYTGFSPKFYYDEGEELYIGGMFWDGRATGNTLHDPLAEQALGPFLNPIEMALDSKQEVIKIIKKSQYATLFRQVFGAGAFNNVEEAYNNVGRAIAAFERSFLLNKFSSKFDKFWKEQGKDVSQFGVKPDPTNPEDLVYVGVPKKFKSKHFTQQEAEGLALFNAVDKGKCALCHLTTNFVSNDNKVYPPVFTDFTYDNLGVPVNPRIANLASAQLIDYGLGARIAQLEAANPDGDIPLVSLPSGAPDGGEVTVARDEAGKFKVPTLRNVQRTAPYAHNGFFATLKTITHFYNTRDSDPTAWPAPEVPSTVNTEELGDLGLTAQEEDAIVAFMKTLTD